MPRLLLGVIAVAAMNCTSDDPCEPEPEMTTCGYCAQDVATTKNRHAGKCRYCAANNTCSGDICGDTLRCESRVFLYIPGATFHPGALPQASGTSAPPITSATPSSQGIPMASTVPWSVRWGVAVPITGLLFGVTELGGYYELPVTQTQSNAGFIDVPMGEADRTPSESLCTGTMQCWTEAPATVTTGSGTLALVGAGGDVGPPRAGLSLSFDRPSYNQSPPTGTGGGTGGGTCPTSGAQLGCCTTSGGIQVLGFGLSTACTCPADTCAPRAGYCGCRACGGC